MTRPSKVSTEIQGNSDQKIQRILSTLIKVAALIRICREAARPEFKHQLITGIKTHSSRE